MHTHRRKTARHALGITLFLACGSVAFGQESDDQETDIQEAPEQDIEEVTVTGTRLATGDPSARIEVITAEDIAGRGFSNVEDIIRSIPQNFSSINSTNNLKISHTPLDTNLGALGLGISTANLRGLGSGNTLVLKNGRKMAGSAGQEAGFVNLRDIPASSIERVEVYLDGASAVYGADAVGGVINIITKKGYSGAQLRISNEQSSSGADIARYSGYLGTTWNGGSVSLNVSLEDSNPYDSRKAGFTTRDWTSEYNGDPLANLNFSHFGGVATARSNKWATVSTSRWGPFNLTLGDHDGRNATVDDFRPVTLDDAQIDDIPLDAGGSNEDTSYSIDIEQTFFDRLHVFGEYSQTNATSISRVVTLGVSSITVPASNAFNPFGQDIYVRYDPRTEVELGLIEIPNQTSETTHTRRILGFDYKIGETSQVYFSFVNSISGGGNVQYNFAPSIDDALPNLSDSAHTQRIAEAMNSSDPNTAINLVGNGHGQNPSIAELLVPFGGRSETTELDSIEAHFSTTIAQLEGGALGLVVGGEVETRERRNQGNFRGVNEYTYFDGLAKPTRDFQAYFLEVKVPLIGSGNARPWLQELVMTIQARRDQYGTEGAAGTDADGEPNLVKAEYNHTSPRIGVLWALSDNLRIRASWAESFKPPSFGNLFSTADRTIPNTDVWDPLLGGFQPGATLEYGGNAELQPEVSTNLSVGVSYAPEFVPGLLVETTLTHIEVNDRIANSHELGQLLPVEIYANLPEYFVRNENGTLLKSISRPANISVRGREELGIKILYTLDTDRFGTFLPGLYYDRVLDQYDKATDDSPKSRFVGESVGVDEYSLKGQLEWIYNDRLTMNAYLDFTPSYLNNEHSSFAFGEHLPDMEVDSRTTVDLSARYRFNRGIEARFGGRNVFDADFPFALSQSGEPYDTKRVDLRGRVWFAEVSYDLDW